MLTTKYNACSGSLGKGNNYCQLLHGCSLNIRQSQVFLVHVNSLLLVPKMTLYCRVCPLVRQLNATLQAPYLRSSSTLQAPSYDVALLHSALCTFHFVFVLYLYCQLNTASPFVRCRELHFSNWITAAPFCNPLPIPWSVSVLVLTTSLPKSQCHFYFLFLILKFADCAISNSIQNFCLL